MKKDYDKIEEELRKKARKKKRRMKVSGRSVFGIKKIIDKKKKN